MAKAKAKKIISAETRLKILTRERDAIVDRIGEVAADAAKRTEKLQKRLVEVDAKIAALGTPEA